MSAASDLQAYGGQYISTSTANSGTATLSFEVPLAGTYYVWCRILAPVDTQDSFFVTPEGAQEDVYDDASHWIPQWQWTRLNGRGGTGHPLTINPRTVDLVAGTNTIQFRGRETSSKVDRILLTNDPNFVPTEGNVTTFPDSPPSNPFYDYIETIGRNDISTGCGGGNYCPSSAVTRAQMAVFLLKAEHGSDYTPPAATGNVFTDVARTDFAAAWIEQLHAEGITSGCGQGQYCPNAVVTRAQMAVFLLRAVHGSSYAPPPPQGIFGDLVLTDPFTPWIEELSNEGVTAGCGNGNYCPNNPNTRGQMAAFLVRAFGLQ
jgi:hypothetical protein